MSWTAFLAGLLLVVALAAPVGASAGARYDVSYVWAGNLANVKDYARAVGRVLGPAVSRQLRVVRKGGLYGLIYNRRGDSEGAAGVARAHSRLLRSHGLEAAAPIRSQAWNFVDSTPGPVAAAPVKVSLSPRLPSTSNEPQLYPGNLSVAIDRKIKSMRRQNLIASDERTAWLVYDFTTGKKLVGINEDVQFQAASLIKPFLAMAFLHRVKHGPLIYGPKSRRHMERMIRYSSNRSTNWVMRHLGGPQGAQAILKKHYSEIFKDTSIVEYIPAGGRTYKNKASAHDYGRFLYALWNESIPGAREIKRLMALPGPDRLHTGADAIPEDTLVYNKTGSTARLCGDIGIIVVKGQDGRHYAYTIVGIVEKQGRAKNYSSWIRSRGDVIREVSNLVYIGISQQHNLQSSL